MSLTTFSSFYYGHTIDSTNNIIAFNEGGAEIEAEIEIGSYTLTEFAEAVEAALNEAGGQTYTVTVNRSTRVLTIAASSNFSLLVDTASSEFTAFSLMGFTGADRTGANSYAGNAGSGSSYAPQFILQDHIASGDYSDARGGVVNEAASGEVEVVKFAQVAFVQMNIRYATDIDQGVGGPITTNATGVADLRAFMNYAVTKAPIEYMPSSSVPATYQKLILESTPLSQKGLGYKLKELYDQNCPGYFETGILKWRVVE